MTAVFKEETYQNKTDEWYTPKSLVRPLANAVDGFDLDPASGAEEDPHADVVYTQEDNGLEQEWFGHVFCNPPFSEKTDWLKKAIGEVNEGNDEPVVMVLPVDTSTQWYHNYVTQATAVCFLGPGRTKFSDDNGSPNFSTMLVVFGDIPSPQLLGVLNQKGIVYYQRGLFRETQQTRFDTNRSTPTEESEQ